MLSSEGSCPEHLEDPARELSTLPGTWESLVSVGHIVVNKWAPMPLPLLILGRRVGVSICWV